MAKGKFQGVIAPTTPTGYKRIFLINITLGPRKKETIICSGLNYKRIIKASIVLIV